MDGRGGSFLVRFAGVFDVSSFYKQATTQTNTCTTNPHQVRSPPAEGVYLHGLFLDGAAWSKQEGVMVESEPKKLFVSLPVLYVSANTKSEQVHA